VKPAAAATLWLAVLSASMRNSTMLARCSCSSQLAVSQGAPGNAAAAAAIPGDP
jgi:hypothetical protein